MVRHSVPRRRVEAVAAQRRPSRVGPIERGERHRAERSPEPGSEAPKRHVGAMAKGREAAGSVARTRFAGRAARAIARRRCKRPCPRSAQGRVRHRRGAGAGPPGFAGRLRAHAPAGRPVDGRGWEATLAAQRMVTAGPRPEDSTPGPFQLHNAPSAIDPTSLARLVPVATAARPVARRSAERSRSRARAHAVGPQRNTRRGARGTDEAADAEVEADRRRIDADDDDVAADKTRARPMRSASSRPAARVPGTRTPCRW